MNGISKNRKIILIGIVVALIAFSWIGYIDKYSSDYTHRSILEAGAAYGISRGLNAAVSVAQTSTIQMGFGINGSITIGEILDPINDLIERFSEILTISLSSLALQKILLSIASNTFFKIMCTVSGIIAITFIFLKRNQYINYALKMFFLLVVIRLSLAIVLSINSIVDNAFLQKDISENNKNIQKLQSDVDALNNEKSNLPNQIKKTNKVLILRQKQKKIEQENFNVIIKEIQGLNTNIDKETEKLDLQDLAMCKLGRCPKVLENIKIDLDKLLDVKDSKEDKIKDMDDEINKIESQIQSYEDLMAGDIPWYKNITNIEIDFINLKNIVSTGIDSIINLLVLFLLKTIFIPIVFFYLFMRSIKNIWIINWDQFLQELPVKEESTNKIKNC